MLTHELDTLNDLEASPPVLLGGISIVWRRKGLIAASILIAVFAGYAYLMRQPHVFESTAQVLVIKRQPEASFAGFSQVDEFVSAQAKLIKSPLVIGRALSNPNFPRDSIGGEDPLGRVSSSLAATVDGNLLTLAYRGPQQHSCKTILNAIIESYELFLNETLRSRSQEALRQISSKAEQLEAKLHSEQLQIQQLENDMPLMTGPDGQNLIQRRLAALEAKRYDLRVRRRELELRLQIVEKQTAESDRQGAPRLTPAVGESSGEANDFELTRELLPLQVEESKLLEDMAEDHPDVREIRRQIALKRDYHSRLRENEALLEGVQEGQEISLAKQLRSMRTELTALAQSEEAMDVLLDRERAEARSLGERDVEASKLASSIARTKRLHSGLMDQLQQYDLGERFSGYSTTVIAPSAAGVMVAPDATRIFIAATVLGLLVGIGLALLADLTDKRFHSLNEIPERLRLPVLGEVPYMKSRRRGASGATAPLLVDYQTCQSDEAEAFRDIRTAVLFGEHSRTKCIQITSPQEGDGKTTIVANLGVAVAEAGKRTLLIDADLRNPQLHEMFGLHSETGLVAILTGNAQWESVVQPTDVAGLDVLPCGPTPLNPSELLTSPRLHELLHSVSACYDQILIDSSAMLTASDSHVVAYRVDGVILTVRIAGRDRFLAERALSALGPLVNRAIGVVMTNPSGYRRPWQFNPFQTAPLSNTVGLDWASKPVRQHHFSSSRGGPDYEETQQGIPELEEMLRELKADIKQATAADESRPSRVANPSA